MRFLTLLMTALAAAVLISTPSACQVRNIQAVKAVQPPNLDGMLDDDCWQRTADTEDFRLPITASLAPEKTAVWICYDDKNIYIAFKSSDSQPSKIAAQQKKRGGSIRTDDYVAVDIDPWHTHRTMFRFYVTARGTQVESLPGAGGSKIEWLGDWHAAAKINDSGWTAEMSIPWAILKYPAGQSVMGLSFSRHHARLGQDWVCPDLGPNCDETLMFDWIGLETPKPKLSSIALHYTNVGLGGVRLGSGVDLKRQLSQETNALVTINPDFGSIEQSVDSIDFSYSPRVLSDNRPFFAEGNRHQDFESRMFYSRDIADVDFGAKITGQTKRHDFSALMTTGGRGDRHLYYKSRWDFNNINRCGIALTSTREPGIDNSAASFHGRLGKSNEKRTDFLEYRLMKSFTSGEDLDGVVSTIGACGWGGARQVSWGLWYTDINPDYFPADGIVTEPDLKGWDYNLGYGDEYEQGNIQGWWLDISGNNHNYHSGLTLSDALSLSASVWTIDKQFHIGTSWRERGLAVEDDSYTVYKDRMYTVGGGWKQNDMYARGWFDINFGKQAGGNSFHAQVRQGVKLGERFRSDLSVEYLRMTGPYAREDRQSLASFTYDLSSERSVSARLIERDGKFNLSLGFRQAVRRGEDIYLLFGDPNADKTKYRVILKLIRPVF